MHIFGKYTSSPTGAAKRATFWLITALLTGQGRRLYVESIMVGTAAVWCGADLLQRCILGTASVDSVVVSTIYRTQGCTLNTAAGRGEGHTTQLPCQACCYRPTTWVPGLSAVRVSAKEVHAWAAPVGIGHTDHKMCILAYTALRARVVRSDTVWYATYGML
eukprot:gene14532-biopygen2088